MLKFQLTNSKFKTRRARRLHRKEIQTDGLLEQRSRCLAKQKLSVRDRGFKMWFSKKKFL